MATTDPLAMLSEQHVVLLFGGKTLIFYWEGDLPAFASVAAARAWYLNVSVSVKVPDPNGGTTVQRRPAFDVWMRSSKRPTAKGLTIAPGEGRITQDGQLNLWRGFSVDPKPGDWSLIRDLVVDVLCDGNEQHADYVLRWVAWKLQNPTGRPEVAVVFRGKKGAGKGTFIRLLLDLFGAHAKQVTSSKHLTGSFNGHLAQALLVNADEAFWAGDQSAEGVLKARITEPKFLLEYKGVDAYETDNRIGYLVSANAEWVVPASEDERRYAVFDVSEKRLGDFAYFDALNDQIANGGAAAFLHAMLNVDLEGWHPRRDVPKTEGLARQQRESAKPEVLWLASILDEGTLPGYVRDESGEVKRVAHPNDPTMARSQLLWRHAKAFDSRLRYWTHPSFSEFLEQFGVVTGQRSATGRYKQFPPLAECRRAFQQAYPWYRFDTLDGHWRLPERRPSSGTLDFGAVEQDEPRAGE